MARSLQEKDKNFTVFGEETEFDGVLEFSDDLVIAGKFNGTINATGNLELAKSAVCKTDVVKADSIIIAGTLVGNVEAIDKVEVLSGSSVTGNVLASRLRIDEDVQFDGEVTMTESKSPTDIFSVNGKELKKTLQLKSTEEKSENE